MLIGEMRQIIGSVRSVATALAQVPAVVAAASEGAGWSEGCAAVVAQLRRQHPGGLRIGVAGADGAVVCTDSPVPLDINVRGDHVRRAMETGRFVVGNYGEGPSGEAYLSFAQPLFDEADQPIGAIILGLNLRWLAEHLRERHAGTDASISIADRNLVYLLRLPEDDQRIVGQAALPEHRPLAALADQGAVEARGADGVMRVGAITAVAVNPAPGDRYDLLVGFGVSRDAAFAPINRGTRNAVLLLALSLLFAMTAAWIGGRVLVRRPVEGLLAAAERWRKGDYSARVPEKGARAEFGQLAHAFNAMASGIEQRTRQLQTSETRFRTLASLVPNFVWFADRHGKLIYANERWYRFTGQHPEDEMPVHWPEALHPGDAVKTLAAWHHAVTSGTSYEAEFRLRRHDGAYHWVLGRAEPLREEDGRVTGWFGSGRGVACHYAAVRNSTVILAACWSGEDIPDRRDYGASGTAARSAPTGSRCAFRDPKIYCVTSALPKLIEGRGAQKTRRGMLIRIARAAASYGATMVSASRWSASRTRTLEHKR